jgi:microcystin-dependent protein
LKIIEILGFKKLTLFNTITMAEPFLSEIRMMSFGFAPRGWALTNGQLLPINQNQALFSLLGTTFGGDGRVNFALPDLRGRTPIHVGSGHILGERGGEQAHTLSISEIPTHRHVLRASSVAASTNIPAAGTTVWGDSAPNQIYDSSGSNLVAMGATAITNTGGSQAHLNMQPFLTLNFSIALQGIFPSPT